MALIVFHKLCCIDSTQLTESAPKSSSIVLTDKDGEEVQLNSVKFQCIIAETTYN